MILKYGNQTFGVNFTIWRILTSLDSREHEFGCYDIDKNGEYHPTTKLSGVLKDAEILDWERDIYER